MVCQIEKEQREGPIEKLALRVGLLHLKPSSESKNAHLNIYQLLKLVQFF